MRRLALFLLVVSTIGCDRVTKHMAATTLAGTASRSFMGDMVRLQYAENAGGFLSIGADLPPATRTAVFTIGSGVMLLALVGAAIRLRWRGWPLLALGLFVAGSTSNLVDRIVRGSVIDFMNVGFGPIRTGIFNVADMAIMLGAGILLLASARSGGIRDPFASDDPLH
jgi:signal peptidase II